MPLFQDMRESRAWKTIEDLSVIHWVITALLSIAAFVVAQLRGVAVWNAVLWVVVVFLISLFFVGLYHWERFLKSPKAVPSTARVPNKELFSQKEKTRQRRLAGILPKPVPDERPDVMMEWDSTQQSGTKDKIKLRNIGKLTALCIKVGEFSWPELTWHRPVEFQSLHPNEPGQSKESQFSCRLGSSNEIGNMSRAIDKVQGFKRGPLMVPITFSDQYGNEYSRTFYLERGATGDPAVMVTLGPLEMI